jgi:hypothetical protein
MNEICLCSLIISFLCCRHKGCSCKDGFEGDFCEYVEGEAPVKVASNTGLIIFLIVSIVILSIAGGFYVRKGRRATRSGTIESSSSGGDIEEVKVHKNQAELT